MLISKLLQSLANGVEFDGSKEDYMKKLNPFIKKNKIAVEVFFDLVTNEESINKTKKNSIAETIPQDCPESVGALETIHWFLKTKMKRIHEILSLPYLEPEPEPGPKQEAEAETETEVAVDVEQEAEPGPAQLFEESGAIGRNSPSSSSASSLSSSAIHSKLQVPLNSMASASADDHSPRKTPGRSPHSPKATHSTTSITVRQFVERTMKKLGGSSEVEVEEEKSERPSKVKRRRSLNSILDQDMDLIDQEEKVIDVAVEKPKLQKTSSISRLRRGRKLSEGSKEDEKREEIKREEIKKEEPRKEESKKEKKKSSILSPLKKSKLKASDRCISVTDMGSFGSSSNQTTASVSLSPSNLPELRLSEINITRRGLTIDSAQMEEPCAPRSRTSRELLPPITAAANSSHEKDVS